MRQKRLKPVIDFIRYFCVKTDENKCDVLFLTLRDALQESCDSRSESLESIWQNKEMKLSAHECLAMDNTRPNIIF